MDYEILNLLDLTDATCVYPLAVASLQSGIYASLKSYGIGPGDTVLCDPIFPYATLATLHSGANPVFPLLNGDTVPTPDAWRDAWKPDVRAVAATLVFGRNSLTKALAPQPSMCPVILDCAFSPFSYRTIDAADIDVIGYSFASGKPLSCGEGGLLLFNNAGVRERALRWSRFGVGDGSSNQERIPGLNFCLSPALLPVLKISRTRLAEIQQRLIVSWEKISDEGQFSTYRHDQSEDLGWFQAFLLPEGIKNRELPTHYEAEGIIWKRCGLRESATALVASAPDHIRSAAENMAKRLIWYRPNLPEPWEHVSDDLYQTLFR